jgi:hypothetical protein
MNASSLATRPSPTEAANYYFTYINQVPDGDIVGLMAAQVDDVRSLASSITDEQSLFQYAPGKWSIREVMNHLSDCERLFVARAFWFARGFESPLPDFDQGIAASAARADLRQWDDLIAEFDAVRAATLAFFRSLPAEAWARRGVASDNEFTVRALAFIVVGHVTHHTTILRERYQPSLFARP